jgi:hypothetical protein
MCLAGSKVDWMTNLVRTRKMPHHLLDHKNQQQNNEKSTNPILLAVEANGTPKHWKRPWMQLRE